MARRHMWGLKLQLEKVRQHCVENKCGAISLYNLLSVHRSVVPVGLQFHQCSLENVSSRTALVSHSPRLFILPEFIHLLYLSGLGFDTATEISLLAISAAHAGSGMPLGLVLFLPALFTAGMTLIDTMDGIAMLAVYAWANIHPAKKRYYNFIVTLLSVLIAFIVGIIQVLSIVGEKYELSGGIWDVVGGVGENSDTIGFVIIATFMLMLIVSAMVYRFSGLRNTVTDPNTLEEQGLVRSDSSTALGSQHGHEKRDVTVITVSNDRTANHEQGQSPPHSEIVVN
ncbi:high-affinity nickel-transport protein-domain-containing protein [Phlyctochytrium arcticum]|nr:high-affinity nickel-transport protein-domain-containing protein [Phlyctochytrium arcticum]